jgi:hypothetical protein
MSSYIGSTIELHLADWLCILCLVSLMEANQITGVEDKHLPKFFLTPQDDDIDTRFRPERLMQSCEALGKNYSELSLYHLDLGPGNIVIDFECVGYVPDDSVRTDFRVARQVLDGLRLRWSGWSGVAEKRHT